MTCVLATTDCIGVKFVTKQWLPSAMCEVKVRLQQLHTLDDFKPPTKRLKVTKDIKVFPEQMLG